MDQPGYFDLRTLALYSCVSVRWLRDRLADRSHPLPYHRIEGKLLVKRTDFDSWIECYRVSRQASDVDRMVEDLLRSLSPVGQRT